MFAVAGGGFIAEVGFGGALTVDNAPEGGGRVRAAFRVMEEAKT